MKRSTGYEPEVQTTIPSKSISTNKKYAPIQIYQSTCARFFLSRQLLKSDITVLRMKYQTHTIKCHLPEHKLKDDLKSFICYRWVTFGVNKKGILNNGFFSTEEAIINKRLLHFFIFCLFQKEVSLREEDSCLNVVVRQQMLHHLYGTITR